MLERIHTMTMTGRIYFELIMVVLLSVLLQACGSGSESGGGGATDALVEVTIDSPSIKEGDTGTSELMLTVNLNAAAIGDVTIAYSYSDLLATEGADYNVAGNTLVIAEGDLTAQIPIQIIGDTKPEADETLSVVLLNPSNNVILATSTATVTIEDDDTVAGVTSHTVTVNSDGSYQPLQLYINDGDTVTWQFPDRQRAIVRLLSQGTASPQSCNAYAPYETLDTNEFSGPMPRAASGIFALGPKDSGYKVYDAGDTTAPCSEAGAPAANGKFLCPDQTARNAPLQEILDHSAIAGVFLRFEWDEIETAPGVFDWSVVDTQVDRVVKAGKLYSLAFKAGKAGTPNWLFSQQIGLNELQLQDTGSLGTDCGFTMSLGNPTTPLYGERYRMLLVAVADHLKENAARYRALAYIKPSGANLISHENRLPNRCNSNCSICNTAVWAADGYTPAGLYAFYQAQFNTIASTYPVKDMSYMLIQAGFPQVTNATDFEGCSAAGCDPTNIPGLVEQTKEILDIGAISQGTGFIVQHNALKQKPTGSLACPNEGVHPAIGPFASGGSACPNPHVLRAGEAGQITAFQTMNRSVVDTLKDLDATLQNALDNSDAIIVEPYETLLWEALQNGGVLDPLASTRRTLEQWNEVFKARRREQQFTDKGMSDPYPQSHSHVFKRTDGGAQPQIYFYTDPASCGKTVNFNYGEIRIMP